MPINNFVVAGLGVVTVFAALICIIFICNIMGFIFSKISGSQGEKQGGATSVIESRASTAVRAAAGAEYVPAKIKNRGEVMAAICAAISEDSGADISKIRILSVKERADAIANRGELCAAIGAVISADTGADRVKIHSIKRV